MKRHTTTIAVCVFLLLTLTVIAGGENPASRSKLQTKARIEQQTSTVETSLSQSSLPEVVSTNESVVLQKPAGTETYDIPWQSINGGGGDMQSASYQMKSSVAQSVTGFATSANYQAGIGYWYGTGGSGGCECGTPFGDVNDDGGVNPIDVVYMVNFAYKGLDGRIYPTPWNCDYEIGDVNCDNQVNPIDVVYYVNYAYKSQDAFCYPCGP